MNSYNGCARGREDAGSVRLLGGGCVHAQGRVSEADPLLDRATIQDALRRLGERLARRGVVADIYVIGGAAMTLAYDARRSTRDRRGLPAARRCPQRSLGSRLPGRAHLDAVRRAGVHRRLGCEDRGRLLPIARQGAEDQLAAAPGPEVLTDQLPVLAAGEHIPDEGAERITALGGSPNETPGALVAQRDWDDYSIGRADALKHLGALDVVYTGITEAQRAAIDATEELDLVTHDMLIGQSGQLEQFHWFIRAERESACRRVGATVRSG